MLDTSKIPTKRVDGYYTHITNCITKIPQDIKLEIVDGTLTLKAGSKIYDGNNLLKIINEDMQLKWLYNGDVYIIAVHDDLSDNYYLGVALGSETVNSIPTQQETPDYIVRYCTVNKKCYYQDNGGFHTCSIILAQVSAIETVGFTSINKIFNGFSYIGNTIFVLPDVEGIIPNGFNEDGSIRNIHCQIEEVQTKQTLNGWNNHWYVHLMGENSIEYHPWELYYNQVDKPMSVGQTAFWYNPNEKIVQSTDDFGTTWNTTRQVTPFLEVFQNGETITSIKPINVYENTTSKTVENKFKVVSELPSFPEVGVFYFVKE